MKIGSGWTRTQKETGKTFISVVLDAEFKEMFPQFKNCNLLLSHIDAQEKSSDKAPGWSVNLILNKERQKKEEPEDKPIAADENIPF